MRGGADPAIIAGWKRVALTEPDAVLRKGYAANALVFAELTKALVLWQKELEGWEMKESTVVSGWLREGEEKGGLAMKRRDVLRLVRVRTKTEIPPDIVLALEGTNDLTILDRWFDAAATITTLDEFRAAMKAT